LIETYRAVRNTCLIDSMGRTDIKGDDLREIARSCARISVNMKSGQSCGGVGFNRAAKGAGGAGPVR